MNSIDISACLNASKSQKIPFRFEFIIMLPTSNPLIYKAKKYHTITHMNSRHPTKVGNAKPVWCSIKISVCVLSFLHPDDLISISNEGRTASGVRLTAAPLHPGTLASASAVEGILTDPYERLSTCRQTVNNICEVYLD
ncbi:unnamed protein product [Euphydryas editha]|uniref:Uncharacterized protein n=1 Tax=Euphydryas editha TaxID=104508 RepID=A0AAU9TGD3_EUPED|nr:unnamed protein product [Euphydryas editha]